MSGRVVVIGDLVSDVLVHLAGPLHTGSDTTASIRTTGGGSGANVAAWLAWLGADVTFIGRVGKDTAGEQRGQELANLGVRLHLAIDDAAPTGTIVVLVTPDGERTMLPDRGANLYLEAGDVPPGLFSSGHLHLSGYTLFEPGPRQAALGAARLARQAGMTISVDPSSAQPLREVGPDQFLAWTQGADLCLPNAAEAAVLTGTADVQEAARALSRHYGAVVVTLGPDGALFGHGSDLVHVDAQKAAVVDTTGAGDAFTAGYLVSWLDGEDVRRRLAAGSAAAAGAVAAAGARP